MPDNNWEKVKEVFDLASRRKPEERREFVYEACDGDEILLAEVESLLSSLGKADSFMETPAVAKVADIQIDDSKPRLARINSLMKFETLSGAATSSRASAPARLRLQRSRPAALLRFRA